MPADLTNASWTCQAAGGAQCGATSGTGDIYDVLPLLPPGGSVTYTIKATATRAGLIENTAEIIPPADVRDIDLSNNSNTARYYLMYLPFTPNPYDNALLSTLINP